MSERGRTNGDAKMFRLPKGWGESDTIVKDQSKDRVSLLSFQSRNFYYRIRDAPYSITAFTSEEIVSLEFLKDREKHAASFVASRLATRTGHRTL